MFSRVFRSAPVIPHAKTPTLVQKISQAFKDVNSILSFRSTILENYLNAASIQYTRRNLRSCLKIFLFCLWVRLFEESLLTGKFTLIHLTILIATIILLMCLYLYTFREYNHIWYRWLSYFLITVTVIIVIRSSAEAFVRSTSFLPYIKLFICISVLLPVKLDLMISLLGMLWIAFNAISTHRRTLLNCENITLTNGKDDYKLQNVHMECRYVGIKSNSFSIMLLIHTLSLASGAHLQLWNSIRRRASFIYLSHAVHVERKNQQCQKLHGQVIQCKVPLPLWPEYCDSDTISYRESASCSAATLLSTDVRNFYITPYHQLTILLADIPQFQNWSSTQAIVDVVSFINELLDAFETAADNLQCERLAIQVGEYAYTCGAPESKNDHAAKGVEMALRMLKIVNDLVTARCVYKMDIRIAVHSFHGNAVVYGGSANLHYTIFSAGLSTAIKMKTICPSGEIILSGQSYELIQPLHNAEPWKMLAVDSILNDSKYQASMPTYILDRVTHSDEDGTTAVLATDNTDSLLYKCSRVMAHNAYSDSYWYSHQSNLMRQSDVFISEQLVDECRGHNVFKLSGQFESPIFAPFRESINDLWNPDTVETTDTGRAYQLDIKVMRVLTQLRSDPQRRILYLQQLPVHKWSNRFLDPEIEKQYLSHVVDDTFPVYVESLKLAPVFDACAILAAVSISAVLVFSFSSSTNVSHRVVTISIIELISAVFFLLVIAWSSLHFTVNVTPGWKRKLHTVTSRMRNIQFLLFVFIFMPALHGMSHSLILLSQKTDTETYFGTITLYRMYTLIIHMMASSLPAWCIMLSFFFTTSILLLFYSQYMDTAMQTEHCSIGFVKTERLGAFWSDQLMNTCINWVIMWTIARLNEQNCRLKFLCQLELKKSFDELDKSKTMIKDSLLHVFPKSTIRRLKRDKSRRFSSIQVKRIQNLIRLPVVDTRQTVIYSDLTVAYFRIENFTKLNDFLPGEGNVLQMRKLAALFYSFDQLLNQDEFSSLTKVDLFCDSYLVFHEAKETDKDFRTFESATTTSSTLTPTNLHTVVNYCLRVQRLVKQWNSVASCGSTRLPTLDLCIGCAQGKMITSIIGTIRPAFTVWGAAIDMAKMMSQMARPCEVVATMTTYGNLAGYYQCFASKVEAGFGSLPYEGVVIDWMKTVTANDGKTKVEKSVYRRMHESRTTSAHDFSEVEDVEVDLENSKV